MASNNYIYKMSNAGGMSTVTRYTDMLAGNTTWSPWEPAGAYDSLATVTVGATAVASINFAGIPTGYQHLQIRYITASTAPTSYIIQKINSDSTAANYAQHFLYGIGSGTPGAGGAGSRIGDWGPIVSTASIFGTGVIDYLDYASLNKNKTSRGLTGYDANGSGQISFASQLWMNSSTAISSIAFTLDTGNFATNSTFSLYGVK